MLADWFPLLLLVNLFVCGQTPSLALALPLTNDEAVALISSSFWQVQLLGLAYACASIDLEAQSLVKRREEGKVEKKEMAGGRDRRTLTDLKGIKRENSTRKGKLAFSSSAGTLPMLAKVRIGL